MRFGVFEVDLRSGELRKAGMRIRLQEQPFKVLCMLLERGGEVVTREELKGRIWPEESFGDFDHAVNVAVAKLRNALGDSASVPRFVETLPRRGYRFLAPIVPPISLSAKELHPRTSSARGPAVLILGLVMVIVVFFAGFALRGSRFHPKGPDVQKMVITRLTHGGPFGPSAAISPDGHFVAYARYDSQSETTTVCILQTATHTELEIPETKGPLILGLTFSPDSNYLYVIRNKHADDPFTHELFRVSTLGGHAEHLLTGVDTPVTFSPDGHEIAYTRDIPKHDAVELRRVSADGTNDRLIATIGELSEFYASGGPAWSPDGNTICLPVEHADRQKRWAIEVVSVADGRFHELFSSHSLIGRPMWQPDGKSLIVGLADGPAGRSQLWTVSFPEGTLRRLTNDLTDYGYRPDISRDGRTIATVMMSYDSSLWSVPRSHLLPASQVNSNHDLYELTSSPDGRIFAIDYDGAPWVMNADGSHSALFTNVRAARAIRVCGGFPVFLSFDEGNVRLLRVNPDGSNPTELVTGALGSLDCSSRGEFVYYLDARAPAKISRVSVKGGTPVTVEKALGESSDFIRVSPDGNFLAYSYQETGRQPRLQLAVIPTTGGPPVKIFGDPLSGLVRWSPDSKDLDYVDRQNGVYNIWEQPLAGGTPKQLTRFTTAEEIGDFAWSTDGSALLLIRHRANNDVVFISNLQ